MTYNQKQNLFATGGKDGTIRVWSSEGLLVKSFANFCVYVSDIFFLSSKNVLVGSDYHDLLFFDFDSESIISYSNHLPLDSDDISMTSCIAIDDFFLLIGSVNRSVITYDLRNLTLINNYFTHPFSVLHVAIYTSRLLGVSISPPNLIDESCHVGTAIVHHLLSGQKLFEIPAYYLNGSIPRTALNHITGNLLFAEEGIKCRLINLENQEIKEISLIPEDSVSNTLFSKDGTKLVILETRKSIHIYHLPSDTYQKKICLNLDQNEFICSGIANREDGFVFATSCGCVYFIDWTTLDLSVLFNNLRVFSHEKPNHWLDFNSQVD